MLTLRRIVSTLRRWLSRDRAERELHDEIQSYADLCADELRATGLPEAEARRRARIELGGIAQVEDSVRQGRAGAIFEQTAQDVRYALRGLRHTPAFTVTAVLTLGLGIGISTAVFAVLNAAVIRPLPYAHPEQLVELGHMVQAGTPEASTAFGVTWPEVHFWRQQTQLFSGIEARDFTEPVALWREGGRELRLGRFTAGLPALLGTRALIGRTFTVDESESKAPVLLISEELWRSGFSKRLDVLGATVTLGRVPFTVVGVMPASFRYGPPGGGLMDAWSGLPEHATSGMTSTRFTMAVCRLRSGVTLADANASAGRMLDQVLDAVGTLPPPFDTPWIPALGTLDHWRVKIAQESTLSPLLTLLGTGALVLLIASANVANLLGARGMARRHELSLRSALGASRARLLRMMLIEGLVITMCAGGLGVLIAQGALLEALSLMPIGMSRALFEVGFPEIDWRVTGFVVACTAAVAVLASLWPAWSHSRVRLAASAGSRLVGTHDRQRSSTILQTVQVALALVLATGAGLVARSLQAALSTDPGFESTGLYSLTAILPSDKYVDVDGRALAANRLIDAVARVSGVGQVAVGVAPTSVGTSSYFEAEGETPIRRLPIASRRSIGENYFVAAGIPLREGREFGPQDSIGSPRVVIIDELLAKRVAPDGHALGRRFRTSTREPFATVVGIVKTAVIPNFTSAGQTPGIYWPWSQQPATYVPLLIRARPAAPLDVAALTTAIWSVESQALTSSANLVSAAFERADTYQRPQFIAALVSLIAATALLTAVVGLYGLLAYSVGRRQREIGVRVALGSTMSQIRRLVVIEALRPVIAGIAIGWVAAWSLGKFVGAFLYGVTPRDPMTFAASGAVLILAALIATIGPIRKATGVDPIRALRAE